jgi:hypothetical protein
MGSRRQIDELLSAGALDGTEPIETYYDFTPWQTTTQDIANLGVLTTTTLTDGATVNWDAEDGRLASLTLAGSRTMAAPTNLKDGATYVLFVTQGGSGSYTLTWNAVFKWAAGTAPTLSTTVGKVDVLTFISLGGYLYGVAQIGF